MRGWVFLGPPRPPAETLRGEGGRHKSCQNPGNRCPSSSRPGRRHRVHYHAGRRPPSSTGEGQPLHRAGGRGGERGRYPAPSQARPASSTTAGHARPRTGRHHRPAPPASTGIIDMTPSIDTATLDQLEPAPGRSSNMPPGATRSPESWSPGT